jgi:hypothetical protein
MDFETWEILLNAPIPQLAAIARSLRRNRNRPGFNLYPIDKDVPPPRYFPRAPTKSEQLKYCIPLDDPNFVPPFHPNTPHPPWPFEYLEIGDSFVAPKSLQTALGTYRKAAQAKGLPITYVSRAINEEWIRIWCLNKNYGPNNDGLDGSCYSREQPPSQPSKSVAGTKHESQPKLLDKRAKFETEIELLTKSLDDPANQDPETQEGIQRLIAVKRLRLQTLSS